MRAVEITKTYLKECVVHHRLDESKNTHLEHLEDLIFNDGLKGGKEAINYLVSFYDMLKGNSKTKFNLTTKWDGAPAIFCGRDPEDGKFFVGTKAVFNKTPLINKSLADIKQNHPDKMKKGKVESAQGLRDKLAQCFTHLQKLNFSSVVQGDLLFTEDSKQTATINGEQHIVFKPNTIIYAVPSDNDLAKDIESAKLGIVFHTEYVGNSMAEMNARFGYDASGLGQSKDVWYRDAIIKDYSGQVTMTKEESELLRGLIETANKNLSQVSDLGVLRNNEFGEDLRTRIKASVNKIIRDIQDFEKDPNVFAQQFISDYKEAMKKAVERLTTDAGKVRKTQVMLDGIKFLEEHKQEVVNAYVVYLDLIRAKELIVKKLANIRQIDTFVQNSEGDYEVTGEEGFVAVDHIGNAIKLVDRLDFSVKNFGSGRPTS